MLEANIEQGWHKLDGRELLNKGALVRRHIDSAPYTQGPQAGLEGRVLKDKTSAGQDLLVQFDEAFNAGHNCGHLGENGKCWYCQNYEMEAFATVLQVLDSTEEGAATEEAEVPEAPPIL